MRTAQNGRMTRPVTVAVIGAGSWGTTVASIVAKRNSTLLWARRPEVAAEVNEQHTNRAYLGDHMLHEHLRATADLEEAAGTADVLVMARSGHHPGPHSLEHANRFVVDHAPCTVLLTWP